MKIFLSVGHSILKNGACTSASGYVNEYQYCKEVGAILRDYLISQGHNVTFIVCPERTFTSSAQEKTYKLNIERSKNYDLVAELHLNSNDNATAHGCEVFYYAGDSKGKSYATRINAKLGEIFKGRGAKTSKSIGGLYMVDATRATAVLVESFFCSNKNDCNVGTDKNLVARKIAEGIVGGNIPASGNGSAGKRFLVKVLCNLNIRSGPGVRYKKTGCITDNGTYTIVETQDVNGVPWGKLKSDAGWISIHDKYVKRV